MIEVESVSVADTLEDSCNSPTTVLLPALESMEGKRHTSYRSNSTNVFIKIPEVQNLNYWERLYELKLCSLQRRHERYVIMYIWRKTQHVVPNIDGTMGHKRETRKQARHGTQCVIHSPTNRNPAPSLQENTIPVFGPLLYTTC